MDDPVSISSVLGGALAVVRRDAQLAFSYRLSFAAQWLGIFFSLTLFFYISRLVRVEQFESPDDYYAFAVVGLAILQILNSTLQSPPGAMRHEMMAGTFERIVVSPFGPVNALLAMLVFPFVSGLANALVMLGLAGVVYGLAVQWDTAVLAIPLSVLGALAYAPFGVMLMAVVMMAKQVTSGTTWIVAGISLVAGLYFPVALLPDWIQWATDVQPFTPSVELLRNVLVGTPTERPVWASLVTMVAFPLILFPVSAVTLRLAIRRSQRRGTIIEY